MEQHTAVSPSKATHAPQAKPNRANQAAGALLLFLLGAVYWIYGFAGEIRNATIKAMPTTGLAGTQQTQTILGDLLVLACVFVVIGFGLLLSHFKRGTFLALFTSILTVSFAIILSPIFSKFWFNIFITNFQGAAPTPSDPSRFLQYSLGGSSIYIDYYNLRIALANSIAQLVVALGLFGRLNIGQIIINCIGFNFCWNLNYFLCAFLAIDSPDSRIYDDYQINSIYLFAACYGVISSFFIRHPSPASTPEFSSSSNSSVTAHLGTFFLFLAFCGTTTLYTTKHSVTASGQAQRGLIWQQAFISTFVALSASVISNYAFSILFNHNFKMGIRASLVGTITGAIMYGPVAATCINMGAAIACGIFSGFISALFFERFFPAINANGLRDSFGVWSILAVSFIGTFLIAPTVLKTYYNYSVDLPTLYPINKPTINYFISSKDVAGWALSYVGVSVAIGLISGLAVGALMWIMGKPSGKNFDDTELFRSGVYGLRKSVGREGTPEIFPSAQELHRM